MDMNRNLICVVCPTGCKLTVSIDNGVINTITGNKCKRGLEYAKDECINPLRTLTSVVRLLDGNQPVISVKSDKPVPKALQQECVKVINELRLQTPIRIGDIIIENILDTGANIVATGNAL